jgi:hypothetical protein
VRGVAGRVRRAGAGGEQAADLRDGQRDHPGIGRGRLIRPDRWRCLGIGGVAEQRGGDSADRQCGHDQHDMAGDRDVEPDLGLVKPEAVLAELEILFSRPSLIPVKKKSSLAFRAHPGRY